MATEVSVLEVKRLKSELEKDIVSMVKDFQNKTGCTIEGFHADCWMKDDYPNGQKQEIKVHVRVAIL